MAEQCLRPVDGLMSSAAVPQDRQRAFVLPKSFTEDRQHILDAVTAFEATYGATFPKVITMITEPLGHGSPT